MTIEITDDDIAYAEKLLLPEGCHFNEERRAFICCMDSRDVCACPGSGKTTALLAKILILARKMPFEDGRGICVLTHTNAAIDIIKERAGAAADVLFRYPNFFGTIQSFVNQFLAIPSYRSEFKKPIVAIDNDRFFSELKMIYCKKRRHLQWMENNGGIERLSSYWIHPETLDIGPSLDKKIPNLGTGTPTYKKICQIRQDVFNKGFLSFHDAYSLALRYLETNPTLPQVFFGRFCMVFLDEAQDTYDYQFRVLNQIFQPDRFIVQCIGDPNQAIFSSDDGYDIWHPESPLHFSDSQRYGDTIKTVLNSVRLQNDISLKACQLVKSYPPQMITFAPDEEQQVLDAFAELIRHFKLVDGPYYAVGWIGKDRSAEGKLCIPTYFPSYDPSQRTSARQFNNLISYVTYAIQMARSECVNHFFEIILHGITRALDVASIINEESGRAYTPISVKNYWKKQNEKTYVEFRACIAHSYLLARSSSLSAFKLRSDIKEAIKSLWPIKSEEGQFFFNDDTIHTSIQSETKEPINQFVSGSETVIQIGTVHSVKGETHAATLYLETDYYGKSDAQRLINFLKGKRLQNELSKERHKQSLKIAHVAFSRPKYLLAFACQEKNIIGHEEGLKKNGWEIHSVSELTTDGEWHNTAPTHSSTSGQTTLFAFNSANAP